MRSPRCTCHLYGSMDCDACNPITRISPVKSAVKRTVQSSIWDCNDVPSVVVRSKPRHARKYTNHAVTVFVGLGLPSIALTLFS